MIDIYAPVQRVLKYWYIPEGYISNYIPKNILLIVSHSITNKRKGFITLIVTSIWLLSLSLTSFFSLLSSLLSINTHQIQNLLGFVTMDLRIHAIHVGEWDGELQPTAGKNYLVCLGNIYSIHQKSHLLLLGWPPCTSFFLFDIPWFKDSNLFLQKIKNELVGVILKGEFKLSIKKWHHSSVHAKWVFSKLKNKIK